MNISDWLDQHSPPAFVRYAKRLSNNDTLANGAHQAGPYIPRRVMLRLFPSLNRPGDLNPDRWFALRVDSHHETHDARAIWYNNRLHDGTRNETRITNFGGEGSILLDPSSAGVLTVFAFHQANRHSDASICHVWVCRNTTEEDATENLIGRVHRGR